MKKSSHPQKKDHRPKVHFRAQKGILERELCFLNLQNEVPLAEYLTEIKDLIQRFPCTEEEKRTLLDFHTGAWPTDADLKKAEDQAREKLQDLPDTLEKAQYRERIDDGSVVKQWLLVASMKLEDRCREILQRLPETPETKRFHDLTLKGSVAAMLPSLGVVAWRWSSRILRNHYKQTKDMRAPGAIVSALKKRKGSPLEDLEEIPDKWVQQVALRVGLDRFPRAGSGQTSLDSPEERRKKAHTRVNKAGKHRNYREAAKRLVQKLCGERDWLIKKRGLSASAATREAKEHIVKDFEVRSRAKDKPAILAIFHELLKSN